MLTLLAQSAADVLDEVVQLFDQAVSAKESQAKHKLTDRLANRAKDSDDKLAITELVLPVLADPGIPDEEVGARLRGEIGMDRLRAAMAQPATSLLPAGSRPSRGAGILVQLSAPVRPAGVGGDRVRRRPGRGRVAGRGPGASGFYATGARKVPAEAPTGFVPTRWRGYLDDAIAAGDATAYRHHWELIVLLCLRDALRSGDVYVPGSRRYANPMAYLIPPEAWPARRAEFCRLADVSADASAALDRKKVDLDEALGEVNEVLADGTSPIRLDDDGNLVIPRLPGRTSLPRPTNSRTS